MPLDYATLPGDCFIRGWVVFGPGQHKGKLYTAADCRQMAANFQRLSTPQHGLTPLIEPALTVGHDERQRLAESIGFPSLGTVTRMRADPNGLIVLDEIARIPTQIGALVNAGWYRDGSIVIAPPLPNPDNQAERLYPVLTAVSLLGEEQPAVPVRYPIPKAVFADGAEVPAERDLTPLAQAMAEVSRNFALGSGRAARTLTYLGRTYSLGAGISFSAMTPLETGMDRAALIKALCAKGIPADSDPEYQGKSDQELKDLLDRVNYSGFSFSSPQMYAACKKMFGAAAQFAGPKPGSDAFKAMKAKEDPNYPWYDDKDYSAAFAAFSGIFGDAAVPPPAPTPATPAPPTPMATDTDPAMMFAAMDTDPAMPAPMKAMARAFSKCFADMKKDVGSCMSAVQDLQKQGPEIKAAAAFAGQYQARIKEDKLARVAGIVDQAAAEGRIEARDKHLHIKDGMDRNDSVRFAAGTAHAGKTDFEVWKHELLTRKQSVMFSDMISDEPAKDGEEKPVSEFARRAMRHFPGGKTPLYQPKKQPA